MLDPIQIEDANWFSGWEMLPFDCLHDIQSRLRFFSGKRVIRAIC